MALVIGARIRGFRSCVDLEIPLSRFTALIGPNGAGKSTVLQALGHVPYSEGEEERAGEVPQSIDLYLELDAEHTVLMRTQLMASLTPALPQADSSTLSLLAEVLIETGRPVVCLRHRRGPVLALDRGGDGIDRATARDLAGSLPPSWVVSALQFLGRAPKGGDRHLEPLDKAPVVLPREHVVSPLTVLVDADDASHLLLGLVREVLDRRSGLSSGAEGEALLDLSAHDRLGSIERVGLLGPILRELEVVTNSLLPAFVRSQGSVVIEVVDGPDDLGGALEAEIVALGRVLERGGALHGAAGAAFEAVVSLARQSGDTIDRHLEVFLRLDAHDGPSVVVPFAGLGRGTRRWISASLREAGRALASIAEDETPTLVLADEPLESLHPSVHSEVSSWLLARAADASANTTVVASTHSPNLLSAAWHAPGFSVVGLRPGINRGRAARFDARALDELAAAATALGFVPSELMLLGRALLLVEGRHDRALLDAVFGPQLAERGVFVHAVGGSDLATVLQALSSDLIRRLGLPIAIMLDKVFDPSLAPGTHLRKDRKTPERKVADELLASKGMAGVQLVPFEGDDIIVGVAEAVIRRTHARALDGDPFKSWPDELQRFRRQPTGDGRLAFKDWCVRRMTGRSKGSFSDLLDGLIAATEPAEASAWLTHPISTYLSSPDERGDQTRVTPSYGPADDWA